MREPPQVQTEPPSYSEATVSFPPHRRRPLLSRTYRTLIGILSHCHATSPQLQTQVGSGDMESRPVYEENIITDVKVTSPDLLVPLANSMDSGNELVQETSVGGEKEKFGLQEKPSSGKHATRSKLDDINLILDGSHEVTPLRTSGVANDLTDENQDIEHANQISKEQTIANSIVEMQIDGLGALEQLEVDKEFSVSDFSEILDSCFGMDMVFQSSDAIGGSQENGTVLEDSTHKNSEHELQLKQMELEKLIYSSNVVEPTSCPNTNDEMEEGEISGDFGAIDALSEDVSLQEKTAEMVHISEAALDKEEFICDGEDSRHMQYEMAGSSLIEIVNSSNNCARVENRTTTAQVQDCHLKNVVHDGKAEVQNNGYLENGMPVDKTTQQNAAQNQISDSTEKDGDMNNKKRKKGPLTKERRAKKKKKERIKRAEKNRQLGIKRLKLPPVLKPKKIVYCRHYLQGRCHEGEKCKFSHDTVPLTKSKPCGHFARHSCMKGDDCPFDHELSKYPCKNYATNGFCSRGSDCLFSHEMPANQNLCNATDISKPDGTSLIKEGSSPATKVTKPEVKLLSSLSNSDSSKMTNKHSLFGQKIESKSYAAGNSPHQSIEPASRTYGKAPKGVSFLLNGGMSLGDTSGSKQGGSSLKTGDGVEVGCKTVKVPGSANKLNEMSKRAVPKKPRGINFLSFAKLPSDDSTGKMILNLLSKHNIATGNSVMEDAGEGKLTGSVLETVGNLKVNGQMNHSVTCVDESTNDAPTDAPQNINFSPFDNILSSVSRKLDNLLPTEGNTALSFVKERRGTSNQLPSSTQIPFLSFSGPGDQSRGQATSFFKGPYLPNAPSSVQKAVQSTLAFAAKFEPSIKVGPSLHQGS